MPIDAPNADDWSSTTMTSAFHNANLTWLLETLGSQRLEDRNYCRLALAPQVT